MTNENEQKFVQNNHKKLLRKKQFRRRFKLKKELFDSIVFKILFWIFMVMMLNSISYAGLFVDENNLPVVKNIQKLLQLTGHYNLPIDGRWGRGSEKALKSLFSIYNIESDGKLDSAALDFLENKFRFINFQKKRYSRVKESFEEKEERIKKISADAGLSYPVKNIFIQIFKKEQVLELWGLDDDNFYKKVITYKFSAYSGDLGPKRRGGDLQIPEGFYYINRFNPLSDFYLSMKINYPNDSDKKLSDRDNPGSDIFIHGSNVTIGCVPITDDKIKELYLMALNAITEGQLYIPVHIFPTRMTDENMRNIFRNRNQNLIDFWKMIKPGYEYFEKYKQIPDFTIDNRNGKYIF
jgi:hypothetical protein